MLTPFLSHHLRSSFTREWQAIDIANYSQEFLHCFVGGGGAGPPGFVLCPRRASRLAAGDLLVHRRLLLFAAFWRGFRQFLVETVIKIDAGSCSSERLRQSHLRWSEAQARRHFPRGRLHHTEPTNGPLVTPPLAHRFRG
jgi:hypothetical protein